MSVAVREATADDSLGVRRVLDAAMLEVREDLEARIEAGDVLVAEDGAGSRAEHDCDDRSDAPILGALVLVPCEIAHESGEWAAFADSAHADAMHVDAVAVRRARRDRGVGSALVREAAARPPRLTAEFDPAVRPFYESLGFEVAPVAGADDRLRGVFEAED